MSASPVVLRAGRTGGLTPAQLALWTAQRLHPGTPLQNMALRFEWRGPIDPDRFVAAFDTVVRSSDALRTVFDDRSGTPRATVLPAPPATTEVRDLPHCEVEAWAAARVATALQLDRSCYDSVLLRHAEDHWSWLLDIHHLVTDAYSHTVVHAATAAVYECRPFDIADAASWRARVEGLRDTPRWQRALEHWRAEDAPSEPLLRDRTAGERGTRADRLPVPLDPARRDAVEALLDGPFRTFGRDGARFGLAATLLAAWLHRIADADELTIGVPLHLRDDAEARRVVGLCMELFPLRIQVDEGETFRSLHAKVQRGLMTVLRHAVPGTAPAQRFDVVCNVLAGEYGPFAGHPTAAHWVHPGHIDPHHRLRLQVTETAGPGSLELFLDVHHGAADADLRRRMPGHLLAALDAMTADPDAPVGSFGLCNAQERATITALRDSGPGAEPTETLPVLLERALAADPSCVVLEEGDRHLDAAAFAATVDGVARRLRALGVGRGDRVGVRMPRSLDAVVAIHAVLRSGASFVVLDPASPPTRLDQQIAAAGVRLVLDELPQPDEPAAPDAPGLDATDLDAPGLDDEAYVLFTSGSTGTPKGVPIPHRGLVEYLRFAVDAYVAPGHRPVVPLFTPLSFDLTITSLFLPFLTGGTLIVHTADGLPAIAEVAAQGRADWVKCTPSHLDLLVRLLPAGHPLRVLVVGGEQFPSALAVRAHAVAAPGLRIFNEYGPTEAVVGCMIHEFDPAHDLGPHVPVGVPAPGADVVLLDRYGHLVPPGLPGEMHLHRPGMTAGYLGGVDAHRFVRHPSLAPHVLYRTGDVAHLDAPTADRPAVMTYHGRRDEQLKVRGMRLEAGEVESVLTSHPAVDRAVVRFWSPARRTATARHCVRCGLSDAVPAVTHDEEGVCLTCHAFDAVRGRAAEYFGDEAHLRAARDRARAARRGDVDCLLLLSGGKDSSYALYRLVELGFEVATMTLDNGFISEEAKANVRRIVEDLGVEHRFVTTPHMPEVFRDSLERYSNVCNGCYKTIYTLGVNLAHELGAPMIVTGLSRGQLFETRLIPAQFADGRFDPAAIDAAVLEARKVYHRTEDATTRLLDTSLFADDAVFEEIEFLDFYRYEDVPLTTMLGFLAAKAPWTRPSDTGRSTNCLINAAGIHTHLVERGFHNYAVPYAWDVRMGHKTRHEALEELDDQLDEADVTRLLAAVGYEPHPPQLLTAWYTGTEVDPEALRAHAAAWLPEHAVPVAFVHVEELPLTVNGKVATDLLPAPTRFRRGDDGRTTRPPSTPTEAVLCEIWSDTLALDRLGVDEDFFALGGASLAALEMIVRASAALGVVIPESAAFEHRTVAELAVVVDRLRTGGNVPGGNVPGAETDAAGHDDPTTLTEPEGEPPLSDGQRALLYESDRRPDTAVYNITQRYRIRGPLDLDRLHAAFRTVVARHQALHLTAGAPRRALSAEEALSFRVVHSTDTGLDELAEAEARTRIDLREGPLVRVVAARLGDDDHGLVLTLHHLTCDATSLAVIWRDLAALLAGSDLPPVAASFGAHAAWRAARLDPAQVEAAVDALDGATAVSLPFTPTRDRAARATDGLVEHPAIVAARGLPGPEGRPFPALLAVFAGLLQHLTDEDEVLLGVATSTRDHPAVASSVGYFLDVLPVRLRLDPGLPVAELVATADRTLGAALDRRLVPYARIAAGVRRRGGADPARVLLVLEEDHHPSLPGCTVEQRVVGNGAAAGDLTVFVRRTDGGFALSAEFAGEVLGRDDARAVLDAYARLLEAAGTDPAAPFLSLPVTADPDLAGPELGAHPPTVTAAVLAHARSAPDAPAVRCGTDRRTYGELVERATRIAQALAARGVGRGDRVALLLPRSTDLVASVLAAHLLGAAEVPVDPTYPQERIDRILGLVGPVVVVTPSRDGRAPDAGTTVLALDELGPPEADAPPPNGPEPDDPAYVIFTSGSTGTPRGVEVRHRQLAASTFARLSAHPDAPARFLLVSSFGFDSSVAGLFWTLATGGELVVPTDAEVHDLDRLGDLADRAAVTHLLAVPTLYGALLERRRTAPASLRQVIVAGESCPPALVRAHHERSTSCRLANEYGPTETTVWATVHHLDPAAPADAPVPIGDPIPGVVVRVSDRWGRARPAGAAGELRVGGAGLTDGYLADPAATAERFPTDGDGRRWYRTGDLVRRRGDGPLEFLGRLDGQLSIGGHRIEPEEVEAAILALPGVRAAAVRGEAVLEQDPFDALRHLPPADAGHLLRTAADDPAPADRLLADLAERSSARTVLVAHVEGDDLDEAALRRALGERLPRHLVPVHVRVSPALPRSPHGKLDRQAIPPIVTGRAAGTRASGAPSVVDRDTGIDGGTVNGDAVDDVLRRMVAVWRSVLADDDVGPDTDLFAIGGDSLTAVALVARIETELGVHLPISALLGAPTPRRLAALVRRQRITAPHVVELRTGLGLPLFLMPTGPGHLLGYAPLLQALPPDLPLYGFTAPGSDGRSEPLATVEEHARLFLDELLTVQPSGPYRLLGWSTGGLFAYELARRLREAGHDVDLVAMIDTLHPTAIDRVHAPARERYRTLWEEGGPGRIAAQLADGVRRRGTAAARDLRIVAARAAHRPIDLVANDQRMVRATDRAVAAYRPEPIDAPVVLFAAGDTRPDLAAEPWSSVVPDLVLVQLEGAHAGPRSITSGERVGELAEHLRRRLR